MDFTKEITRMVSRRIAPKITVDEMIDCLADGYTIHVNERDIAAAYKVHSIDLYHDWMVNGKVCIYCHNPLNWKDRNIDHDHGTNVVRGVAHKVCNVTQGYIRAMRKAGCDKECIIEAVGRMFDAN